MNGKKEGEEEHNVMEGEGSEGGEGRATKNTGNDLRDLVNGFLRLRIERCECLIYEFVEMTREN